MSEGLSICAQVPANIARFASKKIVQYDGLHSLVGAFYRALQTGSAMPVPADQARSIVYWTSRVSEEADAAKTRFQAQFLCAGHAKVLVTGATGLIGRHLLHQLLQKGNRELPLVYVDDVVNAIVLAAENSKFDGSVLHIVDRTHITQNQLVRDYIQKNAQKAEITHVPVAIVYSLAFGLEVLSKALNRSVPLTIYRVKSALARMQFDCSRAEKEIGWQPRVGTTFGLQETMAAERANSGNNVIERVQANWAAK